MICDGMPHFDALTSTSLSLSIFKMRWSQKKLLASFTTLVIVVTSIDCWCGASRAATGNGARQASSGCSCCDDYRDCDRSDANHCPLHKHKSPDHSCLHCQGALVSELSAVRHLSTPFDYSFLTANFDATHLEAFRTLQPHAHRAFADLPPSCCPDTLLGLHCALTL